ncbi:hypothetical protein L0156_10255 [bacterium]|nr:hypothetical protein [bacterium]
MFKRASLRYLIAIVLLLISRSQLRLWYEFEHVQTYVVASLLFLVALGLVLVPQWKQRERQLSWRRTFVLFLLTLLAIPWGEWFQLSMPFARENWSQQILDQTLFLICCFFFFSLAPKAAEKIQKTTRSVLSFLSRMRWIVPLLLILLFCITSLIGIFVAKKATIVSDSGSHLFQARIFAQGKLTAPVPPSPEFFNNRNDSLIMHEGKWFSVYLPGFPLILSLASPINAEWFVPPLLSVFTLAIWLAYIDRWHSRQTAIFFGILFACSPFVLLQSSTIMIHIAELFLASAAIYLIRLETEKPNPLRSILLALTLFLSVLTRGFSLMPFLLPVLTYGFLRRRSWRMQASIGIGILSGAAAIAIYQWQTTGSPWLSAYILEFPGNRYGFGESLFGQIHTPLRGLEQISNNALGLNYWLNGWYSGTLFFIFAAVILGASADVWDQLLFLSCLCLAAFYYSFVGQDLFVGPRYFFVCSPVLLLFVARCLDLQNTRVVATATVCLVASLPFQVPKLVSAWIPIPTLRENLETLQGKKALIFLPENEEFAVNLNDPFLRNPHILCQDLGERNQKAIETFREYRPYYFGMSYNRGTSGISGDFTLSESRLNTEGKEISYFRLALLMRNSKAQIEKDFFDLSYIGPIAWGDPLLKLDSVYRYISASRPGPNIQDNFRAGLHHTAAAILLPRVAFEKNKLQWKKSFDPKTFRAHFLNARRFMANSGELGTELLPALEKVNRRIDRDANQNLSDEEILRYVGRRVRWLEEY